MKRIIYSAAFLALISIVAPRPALAQSTPFLGEIDTFAFNFCPNGWLPVNGQILQISQYEALFSLLGINYGGDGTSTFALPKWGPIYAANGAPLTLCIAITGVFPSRT